MSSSVGGPTPPPVTVTLRPWSGPWTADDPHANFKAEVASYRLADPLRTLRGLSQELDVPVEALVHYVLAKYAVAGSEGLLQIGSTAVERMWSVCNRALAEGTAQARLAAFDTLQQMISWLRFPLTQPDTYPGMDDPAH